MIKRCEICRYWSAGNTDRVSGTCDLLIKMSDHAMAMPTGEEVHTHTETRVVTLCTHVCINWQKPLGTGAGARD